MTAATMHDVLRARRASNPNNTAFTFLVDGETEGPRLTYADLDARARTIAAALRERGLQPGDRALLLYPPGLDFIPAFFGCLYAGVIAVPSYPPQAGQASRTLPRLLAIIDDADVSIVLAPSAVVASARTLRFTAVDWLATDAHPVIPSDAACPDASEASVARDLLSLVPRDDTTDVSPDDIAFLQYTSGSTASPRGVMVTHANLLHNLAYANHRAENDAESVSVSWLPVIHDMGLIEGVLAPIYNGYPAYLMAPASFLHRPASWLRAITRYRATTSGGPNFAYDLCVKKVSDEQRMALDLSAWRIAYNGAEPIRADTLDAFHARFRDAGFRWKSFFPVYGLAESTLLVSTGGRDDEPVVREADAESFSRGILRTMRDVDAPSRTVVSSGHVGFGTNVLIVDPDTHERCASGVVGEIWIVSPSVARGYWKREDETSETFRAHLADGAGPFLRTGDLGVLSDGELFVTGRIKDVLIVRGLKHYPQDLELTVERQHDVIRAGCSAAFSLDASDGEGVAVALEIDDRKLPDQPAERDALLRELIGRVKQAVVEQHGIVLSAVSVLPIGGLPKTSSGKLRRRACRAAFLDGSLPVATVRTGT
jgi:acyl-CoA synthetase (AMP-forming)/AMP-acid ligase II